MADFNTLIADIEAAIYENTEQAITGDALQNILLEMVTDINAAKADQGDLDTLAGVVAGKADAFDVNEDSGLYFDDDRILNVDFTFVQAVIPDLAEIRHNAASPLHWLTSEAQEVEEGRIYTGTGILAAQGEFEVIKCYAVNYTDTAQTITCWRYPDTGSNAQTFTLAPFQVLALTCTIDEQQGSIWTASDSHYVREQEVFVATYGTTTAAEILAAYNAGKVVICANGEYIYIIGSVTSTDIMFYAWRNRNLYQLRVQRSDDTWSLSAITMAQRSDIVSTISSSSTNTDIAGAKAVYDYVAATAACSTTIRTIVTLSQADYDALANKDANTFYIII